MNVNLHMKSGKTLTLKRIKNLTWRKEGNTIVGVEVIKTRNWFKFWTVAYWSVGVQIQTVDLSQIEAIELL